MDEFISELQKDICSFSQEELISVNLNNEERTMYSDLVSKDVSRLSWFKLLSLRGGKDNVYHSLMDTLIHLKKTGTIQENKYGFDPITFFIILKLIIQILILLKKYIDEREGSEG